MTEQDVASEHNGTAPALSRQPSRQERRRLSRQQAKAAKTAPRLIVIPADAAAFARELPTHDESDAWVQCAPARGRWPVLPGGWVTHLDINAWHECAHAIGFLYAGWNVSSLRLVHDTDPATVDEENQCTAQGPDGRDHRQQWHEAAVAAMAGPVAVSLAMAGMGLSGSHDGEDPSGPDRAVIEQARDAQGVAPSRSDAFERALREEAARLLVLHRRQFGRLVAAAVPYATRRVLDASAILAIWHVDRKESAP